MAISYVGGQTAGRAGATSTSAVNFAFTGGSNSTPSAGDLVVVTIVVGSQARNPSQDISAQGYTVLTQQLANGTTYDTSLVTAYKRMGSTPDTSVTMPSTGNIADAQRWTIQCFRGVDATTPMDATAVAATGTATGRPNPGAITPVTAGAWVVICGGGAAATGAAYTAPANFTTGFLTGSTADTNDAMVGSGYWSGWTSGPVDPAAYTGGTTNAVDSWAAYTLALRPAPATQALTPTLYTNTQTFHGPTVTATRALTASLFDDSTDTFYAADVTTSGGGQALTPSLLDDSTDTFYGPSVTATRALTATLYTNTQTVYDSTVTKTYALTPARLDNAQTFYAPTVAATRELTAARFDNAQAFYAPLVTQGAITLAPDRFDNAQSFYAPTVAPGAVALTPDLFTNTAAFYAPTVSTLANAELLPPYYENPNQFYAARITLYLTFPDWVDPGWVEPGWVEFPYFNRNQFFAPAVTRSVTLTAQRLESLTSFYSHLALLEGYPNPADVLDGVVYGPDGIYSGTRKGGGGNLIFARRR